MSCNLFVVFRILYNDQLLLWREISPSRVSIARIVVSSAAAFILLQLLTFAVFQKQGALPPNFAISLAWFYLFLILLAIGMNRAAMLLYDQNDIQLLLVSPIHPSTLLVAKIASLCATSLVSMSFIVIPVVNSLTIVFGVGFLAGYVIWCLLAVIAASCSVLVTTIIVKMLGLKTGRFFTQVISVVLIFGPLIIFILQDFLPGIDWLRMLRGIGEYYFVAILGRGAHGQLVAALPAFIVALGFTICAVGVIAGVYAETIQCSLMVSNACHRKSHQWHDNPYLTFILKEIRLLLRHSVMFGRLFYIAFASIILGPFLLKSSGPPGLIPLVIYLSGCLALEIAYNAAETENAWSTIRLSPTSEIQAKIMKSFACIIFPFSIAFCYAIWICFTSPFYICVLTLVGSLASSVFAVLLVFNSYVFRDCVLIMPARHTRSLLKSLAVLVFTAAISVAPILAKHDKPLTALALFGAIILLGSVFLYIVKNLSLHTC